MTSAIFCRGVISLLLSVVEISVCSHLVIRSQTEVRLMGIKRKLDYNVSVCDWVSKKHEKKHTQIAIASCNLRIKKAHSCEQALIIVCKIVAYAVEVSVGIP